MSWSIWAANSVFLETALGLREAFALHGWAVPVYEGEAPWASSEAIWILVGLTLAPTPLPPRYVVYQMEQLTSPWITPGYLMQLASALDVWEFAPSHVPFWTARGLRSSFVPFSAPSLWLTQPTSVGTDIDVLFYGSNNERRTRLRDSLTRALAPLGVGVHFYLNFDLFGPERDAVVRRAKVVLNLHYYEHAALEVHRLNYLLAHAKCVVSEPSVDAYLDQRYGNAVVFARTDELAFTVLAMLGDFTQRRTLQAAARDFARQLPAESAAWLGHAMTAVRRRLPNEAAAPA